MKVVVEQGSIEQSNADAIVVNLFKGVTSPSGATGAVDAVLEGELADILSSGDFTGELGDVLVLYSRGRAPSPRVLVVGLGERE